MEKKDIYENLCVYDSRNPYYDEDNSEYKSKDCFCDNCYYGRDKLTLEILRLMEENNV